MYKVVRDFFDSTDKNRLYKVGDVYPADGVKANKKRIDELVNGTNCNGKVYIAEVKEDGNSSQTSQGDNNKGNAEDGNSSQTSEE